MDGPTHLYKNPIFANLMGTIILFLLQQVKSLNFSGRFGLFFTFFGNECNFQASVLSQSDN